MNKPEKYGFVEGTNARLRGKKRVMTKTSTYILGTILATSAVGYLAISMFSKPSTAEVDTQSRTEVSPTAGELPSSPNTETPSQTVPSPLESTPQAPAPMTGGPKGEVLAAQVGAEPVTQAEILAEMVKMFGPQVLEERSKSPKQFEQVYALFRDQMVGMKLVTQAAKAQADTLKAQVEVKEKIEKATDQILIGALMNDYMKHKVTDTALQDAFKKYPQEQVFLRHIIVNDESTAKAVIKALQGGASWSKLANDKSIDKQTAKDEGRLPPLLEAQLPGPIAEAIKSLKPGAFTEKPIPVAGKWEILSLEKRQKADFDQAKPALSEMISRQAFQEFVMDLKNKTNVQLYDAAGQPTKEVSPVFSMPNNGNAAPAPLPLPATR